ncbi:UDP-glucose 4-epimerase GalE [Paenibacillus selenitireducens]|uniref:UDP-glucose 4-epimerase n=1 Tax=Paenibacillus selenitireducens TaxID=1324314 RepID=A0A1T2X878_9BACL|nr:UDP-glucose 4-epimerase GalE [Paenibacillus selenitireducens]OPA76077.1 UDP-glucose 4-epimerase GalE [Paenibacillus selenitireducens]
MRILVTGGTGYIGSHTCVELLQAGYEIVVIDNYSNSKPEVIEKIKEITNNDFVFYEGDVRNKDILEKIFIENSIDGVIHFAGLKAVGESVRIPLDYYSNNIEGSLILLEVMRDFNVKKFVFSSSATVYGDPYTVPIKEEFATKALNPYGNTKLMLENILNDLCLSDNSWSIALLRYFNPTGAHSSCLIGENPNGVPNNLFPYIAKVALGEIECLKIYGNDYDTKDGTGVRDYIHVVDLSQGHIKALEKVINSTGINAYNLGTGTGYSVLDVVNTFEKVSERKIPYQIHSRRSGDIAQCYADTRKAKEELDWVAEKGIEEMCRDSWNFVLKNILVTKF